MGNLNIPSINSLKPESNKIKAIQSLYAAINELAENTDIEKIQPDWKEEDTSSLAYIKNKPVIHDMSDVVTKDELNEINETLEDLREDVNNADGVITWVDV